MVSQVGSQGPKVNDKVKWIVIFALIAGMVGGSYYFADASPLLRVIGWCVGVGLAVGIALKTVAGQKLWSQWLEAVQEVRRIHWPTRQETTQTTLAVLAMVVVMGILLWSADFVLLRIIKWLTGHGGA